jgi:hypothetical protein
VKLGNEQSLAVFKELFLTKIYIIHIHYIYTPRKGKLSVFFPRLEVMTTTLHLHKLHLIFAYALVRRSQLPFGRSTRTVYMCKYPKIFVTSIFISKTKTKLHGLSPHANYTDRLSDHIKCCLSAIMNDTCIATKINCFCLTGTYLHLPKFVLVASINNPTTFISQS